MNRDKAVYVRMPRRTTAFIDPLSFRARMLMTLTLIVLLMRLVSFALPLVIREMVCGSIFPECPRTFLTFLFSIQKVEI
jgi:hypothetical protein